MAKNSEEENIETVMNGMIPRVKELQLMMNTLHRYLLEGSTTKCKPETFQTLKKDLDLFHHQMTFLADLGCDLWEIEEPPDAS